MSNKLNDTKEEKSYIIGFILSLLLTIIPYYLVVNQSVTGSKLLGIIIGFAMLQVLVQITFFLHIGRGPKPNWNIFFFISTAGVSLIVVGGAVFIMNQLYLNMSPTEQLKRVANNENIYQIGGHLTGACQELNKNYILTIENGIVSPYRIGAHKCDTLTFINKDNTTRDIEFGEHDNHKSYAGVEGIDLRYGHNETITLSETGNFKFHDHMHEKTAGEFTVNL